MGIYMCMKSGCRVSGEDFAHLKCYMRLGLRQQAPNLTSLWKKGGGRRPEGSKQNLRKALFKLYAARPIPQSQPRGRSAVTAPFHKGSLDADESQYVQYKIYLPLPRLSSLGRVLPRS